MWNGEGAPDEIIEQKGLQQISDSSAIEAIISEVLDNNPKQVEQYRGGQDKLLGFFVGQVMKATQGKANPQQVNDLLKQQLDS
jgi:aspartyl-tRNA(Asn)/glutamyl-tRNA(Gln) amidotransferase subunit B